MATISDAALLLAAQLRALDDNHLLELLRSRVVRANSVSDFFDLADALQQPTSVERVLSTLDRPTLATLAVIADTASLSAAEVAAALGHFGADELAVQRRLDRLVSLALLIHRAGRYSAPDGVTDQLAGWPFDDLPTTGELLETPPPSTLTSVEPSQRDSTDSIAAENAFSTTNEVTELINQLRSSPVRDLARGGVSLPDSKRLAASMSVPLDKVAGLVDIAERAGLIATTNAQWMPTAAAAEWMARGAADRWVHLAEAWQQGVPDNIRTILADRVQSFWGSGVEDYVRWLFPAGVDAMLQRLRRYARDARLLGVTAEQLPSSAGIALLTRSPAEAAAVMAESFPNEVHQVYVQPDLTVISPGPLAPQLDARLRVIADVETRALASTYRISRSSLHHAMTLGETLEGMRSFLAEISLTGVPQPVDYLLNEAAARHGLVRVGVNSAGGSYVSSPDSVMLQSIAVDPNFGPFGLRREGARLVSRFGVEQLFWSLSDARYPVAAEDAEGQILSLRRDQVSTATPDEAHDSAPEQLLVKLRNGQGGATGDEDQAWLSRQIEVAIRNKLLLRVTVKMPDDREVEYTLEPSSVAAGRMRGLDRAADIERTLPLKSIVAVEATTER
ncbi:helicase-associated domain-containing protein [Salinibacterium sp. SWN1162]|uniref:helicase-associated domain-containing protein n=1 Tax=Salinibacterium sp. SWN1162 TaxID=2792053 RepID=UPI0018CEE251|nr:helicase-associated domain-containing protein [Salinibacterium sp. SWN1162]MBH0008667.1 helicase-associated domain-containing protein [Salinibacterium sp. SWN1162]